jgi:mannose-1-phosphate guanylyltransferase
MVSSHLKVVILAGGAGTRLWPMSTKQRPKQFQALVSERTMLQETFDRVAFLGAENIYVATNEEYVHFVREQLPEINESRIIAEPALRDTAPCIGLAAAVIEKDDPEAIMSVIYADHLVKDEDEFKEKLEAAAKLVSEEDSLCIIEVRAKAPNTNLGYVRIGDKLRSIDSTDIHEFKEFKEKPDLKTAQQFIDSGDYLWNTGFYVWRASRILQEFANHMPETHKHLKAIQSGAPVQDHYPLCEKISIDYGIMEKVNPSQVKIIPADLGWSDIGTWAALHEELSQTPEENLIKGRAVQVDSSGNLIYNDSEKEICTLGLTNTIVVHYEGQTLIMPKDRSADLKTLLEKRNEQSR